METYYDATASHNFTGTLVKVTVSGQYGEEGEVHLDQHEARQLARELLNAADSLDQLQRQEF